MSGVDSNVLWVEQWIPGVVFDALVASLELDDAKYTLVGSNTSTRELWLGSVHFKRGGAVEKTAEHNMQHFGVEPDGFDKVATLLRREFGFAVGAGKAIVVHENSYQPKGPAVIFS